MKYLSRILRTGAVRKTPEKIIQQILTEINLGGDMHILEFGAGNGEITQPLSQSLIQHKMSYYAFEIDPTFSKQLRSLLPYIHVVSKDAFDFEKSIPNDFMADYIVSSMPLSFCSKPVLKGFLQNILKRLTENGKVIILFHAFWLIPLFRKQFRSCRIHRFNTLPPYFLLVFTHKSMSGK